MKKNFLLLALCMTWALVTNVQAAFVPTAGTFYSIKQINTTDLVIDANATQPIVKTLAAGTNTQAFRFIPTGTADTYYLQNAAGSFLNKSTANNWTTIYAATTNGTNSQWLLVGTDATSIKLRTVARLTSTNNYLATQGTAASGTKLMTDNNDDANDALSLTAIDIATITPAPVATPTIIAPASISFNIPLATTFAVSGVDLVNEVTISAPGITFSPSTIAAGTSGVIVTATPTAGVVNGNITITDGTLTKTIPYTMGATIGKWYSITQTTAAALAVGYSATGTDNPGPAVVAPDATATTQVFTFIPETGKSGYYNIQNGEGNYLGSASGGWKSAYNNATALAVHPTYNEWTLLGDVFASFRLKLTSTNGYLSTNNDATIAAGSAMYCDKSATALNGTFKLTEANAVVINYVDATGKTLKPSRAQLGLTIGDTYTATEADMASFVDGLGVNYFYNAASTNSVTVAAGNTFITLKFQGAPSIATSVTSVKFNAPLSQTFTVSGINLGSSIVFSAPEGSGIVFSPTEVVADATNVTVTVTASSVVTAGDLTLTSGAVTKLIPFTFGPSVGTWFTITQLTTNLAFGGSTPTQPAVMTPDVSAATQLFTLIPVTGKADTYNIKNAAGNYLKGVGYTTSYQATLDGLNTEWTMTGDHYTSVRLKVGSSQYISSDVSTSGSSFYCDKAVSATNGEFKLTDANFVTINYQDAVGATVKTSRFESGVTIGATYTATEADMATFTTGGGVTYFYNATSTNSTVIVAGSNSITLKFMGAPAISTSASTVGFLSPLTASFTVSGVNLNSDITLTAPAGITLSTYSITKDAVNAIVNVTATSLTDAGNITLTSGSLTKDVAVKSVSTNGTWYKIVHVTSDLPLGGRTATQPAVMTADATSNLQYFTFVPVVGQTDTYTILTGTGDYLGNNGYWSSNFVSPLDATNFIPANIDWTISGDPFNSIRMKIASKNYLASDGIVTGSDLFTDKAIDNANGAFKLVEAPTAILTNGTIGALSTTVGTPVMATITVAGSALTGDIALAISGANADQFAVSTATLTQTAGAVSLTTVTVTYNPTEVSAGHVATLTISSTGAASKTFDLSASSLGTGVDKLSSAMKAIVINNKLTVTGVDSYVVYNVQGMKVADVKENNANTHVALNSGIFVVKSSDGVQKLIIK
ncbi:MAG: MucBP domain-containing protein [Paludibacter sp.]|nr:MucBP domain-containing protein [Paludibacter sp.]